jgi:VWFA-related protein
MQRTLVNLLSRVVGPDDMYAVMTPEMAATDITFARRTTTIEGYLSKYWFWGERERLSPEDPVEQRYLQCYPEHSEKRCQTPTGYTTQPDDFYKGVAEAMTVRRHEKKSLDALTDLSRFLQGVREERKAVIVVSNGWLLYRPDESLMRIGPCDMSRGISGTRGGTDERDTPAPRALPFAYSGLTCDGDRQMLAHLDDRPAFQDLIDAANRANVTFYPLDSRGLAAMDNAVAADLGPRSEQTLLRTRVEQLRTLASDTDGVAVVDTNDLDRGLRRVVDDLTSYYLLGYASTNPTPDGKFRSITVNVKRPGVDVRARRGYRAATRDELDRSRSAVKGVPGAPLSNLQLALAPLGTLRPGIPLRTAIAYATIETAGSGPRVHTWAEAELDASTARQGSWLGGGTVEVSVIAPDGSTLATTTATLKAGERSLTVDVGEVSPRAGELAIRTRISPTLDGSPLTDTVHLTKLEPAGRPLLMRRGPTTGLIFRPTADPQFQRTERLRVDLPVAPDMSPPKAEVLDRLGKPIALSVHTAIRVEDGIGWASAELGLAPLAPGDYVIRLTWNVAGKASEVLTSFRMVP